MIKGLRGSMGREVYGMHLEKDVEDVESCGASRGCLSALARLDSGAPAGPLIMCSQHLYLQNREPIVKEDYLVPYLEPYRQ
jgi:hypothetical protein